jgi:hypothetical protein
MVYAVKWRQRTAGTNNRGRTRLSIWNDTPRADHAEAHGSYRSEVETHLHASAVVSAKVEWRCTSAEAMQMGVNVMLSRLNLQWGEDWS